MLRALVMFLILSLSSLALAEDQQKPLVLNSYADAYSAMQKYNAPGIFVFYADWCQPCKRMKTDTWTPMMPELRKQSIVYFVNVDVETAIVAKWNATGKAKSLPAYAMFSRGAKDLILYGEGYRSKDELVKWANAGIAAYMAKRKQQ